MSLSKISINRPIMMTMILLLFVVLGIIGYTSMSLDLMPAVDIPIVTVRVIYSGAGPQDVETQISKKLEDEISTVSEIDYMQTYSIDNASIIIVFFNLTKDVEIAKQEIADKVAAIVNDLPADADDPIIDKIDISAQSIMDIVLSGSASGIELFEYADNVLKDRFAQLKGIAKVDIIGGNERQIQIIFNREEMKANNISLAQVSQIYFRRYWNKILGNIREGKGEIEMRDEDCLIVAFDRCKEDSLLMVSRRTKDGNIHIVNLIRDNAEGLYLRLTKGE